MRATSLTLPGILIGALATALIGCGGSAPRRVAHLPVHQPGPPADMMGEPTGDAPSRSHGSDKSYSAPAEHGHYDAEPMAPPPAKPAAGAGQAGYGTVKGFPD